MATSASSLGHLSPLAAQVAGHDGVQQLASGLIFKPSKNAEVAFYASLSRLPSTLLPFLPLHHGSLPLPVPHPEKQEERGLVLENLTLPFKRANVLDVKLGTQLWDEGASEEKRERMQKQSRESTSGSDGLRLTGWRIFDNASSSSHSTSDSSTSTSTSSTREAGAAGEQEEYIAMPKAFGKAISSDDLPLGMRHFFGSSLASDAAAIDSILFSSSSSSSSSEEEQSPTRTRTSSLPRATMALLLQHGLLPRLTQLRAAVAAVEWRMRGGSVLIVYEGEAQRLVQNVARAQKEDKWEALCVKKPNSSAEDEARPEEQRGTRVDASAEEEKEKEEEEDSASDSSQIQPVFDVRLIDFAHVTFVAKGQGADEGVLLGLDSTIRLLRGLLQQLQLKLPQ